MEKCRDYDIPLIMHTEDMDQNKYKNWKFGQKIL